MPIFLASIALASLNLFSEANCYYLKKNAFAFIRLYYNMLGLPGIPCGPIVEFPDADIFETSLQTASPASSLRTNFSLCRGLWQLKLRNLWMILFFFSAQSLHKGFLSSVASSSNSTQKHRLVRGKSNTTGQHVQTAEEPSDQWRATGVKMCVSMCVKITC